MQKSSVLFLQDGLAFSMIFVSYTLITPLLSHYKNNLIILQLLAKDPALERFKSYRKSASKIRRVGDYLTIAVVAGMWILKRMCSSCIYITFRVPLPSIYEWDLCLSVISILQFVGTVQVCLASHLYLT